MQYNTTREKLIIPEYGRHIHEMVNYCKSIDSKEDRNSFAKAIIEIMGNLNPHLRDIPDFQHKLWDQFFIMAGFDIDVDCPFPKPDANDFEKKPNKIPYPNHSGKYRYYGKNIQRMIDVAVSWEDGDKKDGLIKSIANQMKKSYLIWNKDTVNDQVIFNQLKDMSNGKIDINNEESDINLSHSNQLVQTKTKQRNSGYSRKRRSKRKKTNK